MSLLSFITGNQKEKEDIHGEMKLINIVPGLKKFVMHISTCHPSGTKALQGIRKKT